MRLEVSDTKAEMTELKTKIDQLESNNNFNADRLEEMTEQNKSSVNKVKSELDEMKQKMLMLEKQERKYNLLFYAFPEEESENLTKTMKTFFEDKLKIKKRRSTT